MADVTGFGDTLEGDGWNVDAGGIPCLPFKRFGYLKKDFGRSIPHSTYWVHYLYNNRFGSKIDDSSVNTWSFDNWTYYYRPGVTLQKTIYDEFTRRITPLSAEGSSFLSAIPIICIDASIKDDYTTTLMLINRNLNFPETLSIKLSGNVIFGFGSL